MEIQNFFISFDLKNNNNKEPSLKRIALIFLTTIFVLTLFVIFTVQILPNTNILTF